MPTILSSHSLSCRSDNTEHGVNTDMLHLDKLKVNGKGFKKKIISLQLQFPYQHKAMQRRRKISMRSKGCIILQQKCSTEFLSLLKLTLWAMHWMCKGHCFTGQKDTKHNKKCQTHWSEVCGSSFQQQGGTMQLEKMHGTISSSANNAELVRAHSASL